MTRQRILVIDDDFAFGRTLCRSFERAGYQAASAQTPEEALEQSKILQPQRIVLDLRLGERSGIQLIRPLLSVKPDALIVVLTGFASLTTAIQAIKLGAHNYIAKPVTSQSILKAFDAFADSSDALEDEADFSPTPLKQLEWEHIQRVLEENNSNITLTARQLRMHRRTLQRKLQKRPKLE